VPNGRSCKWRLQLHHLHRKYATEHIQLCILSAALILQSQLRIKATINRCAQQKQHATSHQQFNIKYKRAESYTGCVGTRTWSDSKIFFSLARTKSCSLFCLVSFFEMPKNSSSARCTILQLELHYKTTVEHMVTKKWSMWTLCGFIMSLQWGWSATIYVWSANNKKNNQCFVECFVGIVARLLWAVQNSAHYDSQFSRMHSHSPSFWLGLTFALGSSWDTSGYWTRMWMVSFHLQLPILRSVVTLHQSCPFWGTECYQYDYMTRQL